MKNCSNCGEQAPDDATRCASCEHRFSFVGFEPRVGSETDEFGLESRKRPDGSALIGLGSACLVGAVLALLIAVNQDTVRYSGPDFDAIGRQWFLTLASSGLFGLGLTLLLAGMIIRAIWFLPGEESKFPSRSPLQASPDREGQSPLTASGDDGAVV